MPWLLRTGLKQVESLLDVVERNARAAPHDLAFEMDDEHLTWSELYVTTSRVAHTLAAAGVKAGDVVALFAENSPFYIAAVLVLFVFLLVGAMGGMFIVPLNALIQFNSREGELGTILAGNATIDAAQQDDQGHRRQAQDQPRDIRLGQLVDEVRELVEDVAAAARHPLEPPQRLRRPLRPRRRPCLRLTLCSYSCCPT